MLPESWCEKQSSNGGCTQEMMRCLGALSTAPPVGSAVGYSSCDGGAPLLLQVKE